MMVVIDASVMLEILKRTDLGIDLALLLEDKVIHAPHLIDLEVASTLRRWVATGEMSVPEALRAFEKLVETPIRRHPHLHLLPGIWSLRHNLTAYDACYLTLARLLGAKLLTIDDGLRKAAGVQIH
jgi:predicted nucleic acid-binding protein